MDMMADEIEKDTGGGTRETMALYDNDDDDDEEKEDEEEELIISFFLEKSNKMCAKSSFSHERELEHRRNFFYQNKDEMLSSHPLSLLSF